MAKSPINIMQMQHASQGVSHSNSVTTSKLCLSNFVITSLKSIVRVSDHPASQCVQTLVKVSGVVGQSIRSSWSKCTG